MLYGPLSQQYYDHLLLDNSILKGGIMSDYTTYMT